MASTVKERDTGWNKLKKTLAKVGDFEVVVGIPGDINFKIPTTAAIGAVHEFGSLDGTIRERSFLRSTFDLNERKYVQLLNKLIGKTVKSKRIDEAALFQTGETVRGDVLNRIRKREIVQDIKEATKQAFVPGTKTRRGDSPALVNTGNLLGSIVSKVRKVRK